MTVLAVVTHETIRTARLSEARRIARDLLIQNEAVTGQRDAALQQVEAVQAERDRLRDELGKEPPSTA